MTDRDTDLTRRKLLGAAGTIGAASALGGLATTSLLWDEEKFGNVNDPNVLQGGELDLKVDWEGTYYNWIDNPTFSSDGLVDQPGPIIELEDVKPGDVLEVTQSAHIFGNPAFLGWHYEEHLDDDNGITEPEDKVNGHDPDDSDGTEGGDLPEHIQVVIWYDDGDNLLDEVLDGIDDDDDGDLDGSTEDYVMDIAAVQDAAAAFGDAEQVIHAGSLASLVALGAQNVYLDANDSVSGEVAEDFPDSGCYQNSVPEHIGFLAWVPRDIPGVNDNIIQTDRLEFQFGFDAVQCRHNVGNDGRPVDGTIAEADADNNAQQPGTATYEVTVENLTADTPTSGPPATGQWFTPPVLASHGPAADVFTVGDPASEELTEIAENGNLDPMVDTLSSDPDVDDVVVAVAGAPPPLAPGNEVTATVQSDPTDAYLSAAGMLICTNDGFTGVDALPLPDSVGETVAVETDAYDAGTEINTEDFADIVPPCQALNGVSSGDAGTGTSDPALAEDGVIHQHPGIDAAGDTDPDDSDDDLTQEAHGWTDPVARITVERTG